MKIKAIWEFDVDDSCGESLTECKKIAESEMSYLIKNGELSTDDFEFVHEPKRFYEWSEEDILSVAGYDELSQQQINEVSNILYDVVNENDYINDTIYDHIENAINYVKSKGK